MTETTSTARIGRRALLTGVAATAAGCTASDLPAPAPSAPDDAFRFEARASFATWAAHVDTPAMRSDPQVLAISGGGEDGAWGAGVLNGWSVRGDRPAFDLVTGISTGALIAPFAFVGFAGDPALRAIYTSHGADDLIRRRGPIGLATAALYGTGPMKDLIAQYVTDDVLRAIADRHADGARLLVATSNLDTARAVVWDMGAIAAAGQATLFREVMRASAALPGIFPPVTFAWAGGARETHVDGGVNMQFLAVPDAALTARGRTPAGGTLTLLVNNTLDPLPNPVPRRVLAISSHALTTMVRAQARSTLRVARLYAEDRSMALRVTSVPPELGAQWDPGERFELRYMRGLFAEGERQARDGAVWRG